jgi:hypothetical protein
MKPFKKVTQTIEEGTLYDESAVYNEALVRGRREERRWC